MKAGFLIIASLALTLWGWDMAPSTDYGQGLGTVFTFAVVLAYFGGILCAGQQRPGK